jgi:hypothetical protein
LDPAKYPAIYAGFRQFVAEYFAAMQVRSGPSARDWEFVAALRPDPNHADLPHILLVGRIGPLTVRVIDLPPVFKDTRSRDVTAAASASIRIMNDRMWAALAARERRRPTPEGPHSAKQN